MLLLYQQVDGGGFFTTHGNMTKQVRLFSYIKKQRVSPSSRRSFTSKCDRVRQLFILFRSVGCNVAVFYSSFKFQMS
ncbi:hypothetical protein O9929_00240 [Vibrio lentus]|nr:hypothetical protein [Vibrio lentus]